MARTKPADGVKTAETLPRLTATSVPDLVKEATQNTTKLPAKRRVEALTQYFEEIQEIARVTAHPEWTAVRIRASNGTLFWGQGRGFIRGVDCAGNVYKGISLSFVDAYKPGGIIDFRRLTPVG
jgi:hypothetical protein